MIAIDGGACFDVMELGQDDSPDESQLIGFGLCAATCRNSISLRPTDRSVLVTSEKPKGPQGKPGGLREPKGSQGKLGLQKGALLLQHIALEN